MCAVRAHIKATFRNQVCVCVCVFLFFFFFSYVCETCGYVAEKWNLWVHEQLHGVYWLAEKSKKSQTLQLLFMHSVCMNSSRKVWIFLFFLANQCTPCNCSWTHKFHFSATFSLKIGLTVLFTHLKIILLQYFSVYSFQLYPNGP